MGGSFPLAAHVRKKSSSRRAIFAEYFITAIAIVADCGSRDENTGRLRGPGQGFRQMSSTLDAAIEDAPLFGLGPATDNRFSRKMDDRIEARNRAR